jgi:hypothetical protein
MTMTDTPDQGVVEREADLILARAHLRLGALGLARAELETLAGQDRLDDEGIRDLAEARWRTGDMAGAGEAAATYLDVVPDDILALVIAAEAQLDLGRPGEARRLAGRALERTEGSLDPIFAGMRRSSIWPAEAGGPVGPVGVLFDDLHPEPIRPVPGLDRRSGDRATSAPSAHAPLDPGLPSEIEGAQSLWAEESGPSSFPTDGSVDAETLFHRARTALDTGDAATAATALILALRSSPSLAPAILGLLSGRADPILVLVRGDAQRIVGREAESLRDHAAAASATGTTRAADSNAAATAPAASELDRLGDGDLSTEVAPDSSNGSSGATEDTEPWSDHQLDRPAQEDS